MKIFNASANLITAYLQSTKLFQDTTIFTQPDSVILKSSKPLFLTAELKQLVVVMPVIIIKVSRVGKTIPLRFASRYYESVSLGYSLFLPMLMNNLIDRYSYPMSAVDFDGALCIGDVWLNATECKDLKGRLYVQNTLEKDCCAEYVLNKNLFAEAEKMIESLSKQHTLKTGDLLVLPLIEDYVINRGKNIFAAKLCFDKEEKEVVKLKID